MADEQTRINFAALIGRVASREAHEIAGRIVRLAIEHNKPLEALSLSDFQRFSPAIGADIHESFSLAATLARRDVPGGTAPSRVNDALQSARRLLATNREKEAAR